MKYMCALCEHTQHITQTRINVTVCCVYACTCVGNVQTDLAGGKTHTWSQFKAWDFNQYT